MTLAMTLGMTIGVRRTAWMMMGELVGVASVVMATLSGVAAVMLNHPELFFLFKIAGGMYLAFLGMQLWQSKGAMAISQDIQTPLLVSRRQLAIQGFVTAVANPKGWAFFIALLPPFIDYQQAILSQALVLLTIILILEFICLCIYASGGRMLSTVLQNRTNVKTLNKIAGSLIMGVAVWLAFG